MTVQHLESFEYLDFQPLEPNTPSSTRLLADLGGERFIVAYQTDVPLSPPSATTFAFIVNASGTVLAIDDGPTSIAGASLMSDVSSDPDGTSFVWVGFPGVSGFPTVGTFSRSGSTLTGGIDITPTPGGSGGVGSPRASNFQGHGPMVFWVSSTDAILLYNDHTNTLPFNPLTQGCSQAIALTYGPTTASLGTPFTFTPVGGTGPELLDPVWSCRLDAARFLCIGYDYGEMQPDGAEGSAIGAVAWVIEVGVGTVTMGNIWSLGSILDQVEIAPYYPRPFGPLRLLDDGRVMLVTDRSSGPQSIGVGYFTISGLNVTSFGYHFASLPDFNGTPDASVGHTPFGLWPDQFWQSYHAPSPGTGLDGVARFRIFPDESFRSFEYSPDNDSPYETGSLRLNPPASFVRELPDVPLSTVGTNFIQGKRALAGDQHGVARIGGPVSYGIPWLRQKQRDDIERVYFPSGTRGGIPTSGQKSQRQGMHGTYW